MKSTRRQFLKRTSVLAGVGLLGGLFKPNVSKDIPLPGQVESTWAGDGPIGVVASGEHAGEPTWASTDNDEGEWLWIDSNPGGLISRYKCVVEGPGMLRCISEPPWHERI